MKIYQAMYIWVCLAKLQIYFLTKYSRIKNFNKDSWCNNYFFYSTAMICLYSLEKRGRNLFKTFKTTQLLCWSIKQILTHAASLYPSLMAVVSMHVALLLANGISMGQNLLFDIQASTKNLLSVVMQQTHIKVMPPNFFASSVTPKYFSLMLLCLTTVKLNKRCLCM